MFKIVCFVRCDESYCKSQCSRLIYRWMEENQCNYDLFEAPNGKEEVINFISIERWIIAAEWIITSSESTARTLGLSMSLGVFLFFSIRFFFLCIDLSSVHAGFLLIYVRRSGSHFSCGIGQRKSFEVASWLGHHLFGTVMHKSNKMWLFCV